MTTGQTFTEKTRAQLSADPSLEFTISRAALEVLVADSERYGELNAALSDRLISAQERLKEVSHSHDGRIVWGRVVEQLQRVGVARATAA